MRVKIGRFLAIFELKMKKDKKRPTGKSVCR